MAKQPALGTGARFRAVVEKAKKAGAKAMKAAGAKPFGAKRMKGK